VKKFTHTTYRESAPTTNLKRFSIPQNMEITIMTFSTIEPQAITFGGVCAIAPIVQTQHNLLPEEFEIDGVVDEVFGTLYRVWFSYHFIGSLYQDLDGKWIAQPVGSVVNGRFSTDAQAILIIFFATGNLVADFS
jgi:hypothetical protein